MKHITRSEPGEYAAYGSIYVKEVPAGEQVLQFIQDNLQVVEDLVRAFPPEHLTTPHAPGEWTIQDILVHIMDVERVFAYRALRIARGDSTPLSGFAENDYAVQAHANQRSAEDIMAEYRTVRAATISLFNGLDDAALTQTGTASNNPLTVRGAAFFIAGHELHHIHSIRENYG